MSARQQAGESGERLSGRAPGRSNCARQRVAELPPEKLLPDGQPTYVASWIYVFGVASIAALIVIIGSGCDPRAEGARLVALHGRRALLQQHPPVGGRAVLLRDGRAPVGQVLDGRLARRARARVDDRARSCSWSRFPRRSPATSPSRTSTPSGSPRRPRTRSTRSGVGAFFNVTNFGQMYSYHVLLLPIAVVVLVSAHVLLVRRHGVVPPIELEARPATRRLPVRLPRRRPEPREHAHERAAPQGRHPAVDGRLLAV